MLVPDGYNNDDGLSGSNHNHQPRQTEYPNHMEEKREYKYHPLDKTRQTEYEMIYPYEEHITDIGLSEDVYNDPEFGNCFRNTISLVIILVVITCQLQS